MSFSKCSAILIILLLASSNVCAEEPSPNIQYYRTRGNVRKLISQTLDGQSSIRSTWKLSGGQSNQRSKESILAAESRPRLISNADLPERLVMVCGTRTVDEIADVIKALSIINEKRVPKSPAVNLHLITSADYVLPHLSNVGLPDFVEVNNMFHSNDVWLRDFGLWVHSPKGLFAVDARRLGDLPALPSVLARMASAELVVLQDLAENNSGNFGGNVIVTPGDVAVIGSTTEPTLREFLDGCGYEKKMVVVDTDWLEVGHIDELLGFMSLPGEDGQWAIVRASARVAFDLLKSIDQSSFQCEMEAAIASLKSISQSPLPEDERYEITEMMTQLSLLNTYLLGRRQTDFEYTPALISLNETVDVLLDRAVNMIQEVTKETNPNLPEPVVIELPALFIDGANGARSLVPNVVNYVNIDEDLLLPDPLLEIWRVETVKRLKDHGLSSHFIKTLTYHALGGGLHCATTVLRRPRRPL